MNSKITDEDLLKLATQESHEVDDGDRFDIRYYCQRFSIVDGKDKIYINHLYFHYKKWSIEPVAFAIFHDMIEVKKKTKNSIFINKKQCLIDLDKLIGDYVKSEKERKKKERLRQISSTQSAFKCKDEI